MRIELEILGRSQFQVTISTGSDWEDEEIKGYLKSKISSLNLFDFRNMIKISEVKMTYKIYADGKESWAYSCKEHDPH